MAYSRTSEPVKLERDCAAVLVPQGDKVTLPAGSIGYITQALGGSFTVFIEGNLFRIAGEDADALGKEPPAPLSLADESDDEAVEQLVWRQLRTCFDPEIPVNIYELGLIYSIKITDAPDHTSDVDIQMTLTSPGCPVAQEMPGMVQNAILPISEVRDVDVDIVWDPTWNPGMMAETAKMQLNMFT